MSPNLPASSFRGTVGGKTLLACSNWLSDSFVMNPLFADAGVRDDGVCVALRCTMEVSRDGSGSLGLVGGVGVGFGGSGI